MATPEIKDFYRRNVPNPQAEPFKQHAEWTSGSTADFTVDPQTDEMMIVDAIDLRIPRNLNLNSSDLEIQGYPDGAGGTKLALSSLDDILQQCDEVLHDDTYPTEDELKVRFKPKPGIKLTHAGGEILVFHNSISATQTITGFVRITVHGWFLSESDY